MEVSQPSQCGFGDFLLKIHENWAKLQFLAPAVNILKCTWARHKSHISWCMGTDGGSGCITRRVFKCAWWGTVEIAVP